MMGNDDPPLPCLACLGYPDERHRIILFKLDGWDRRCTEYAFKLSALKVARTVWECGGGFARFYRAVQPITSRCVKRSVIITKGPIESMTGLRLDDIHQIRYVNPVFK